VAAFGPTPAAPRDRPDVTRENLVGAFPGENDLDVFARRAAEDELPDSVKVVKRRLRYPDAILRRDNRGSE
jgi:hypothetical protein